MKRITAMLGVFLLLLSLAACAPDDTIGEQPDNAPLVDEEDYVISSKEPVEDPAEVYTAEDSDSVGIYEETGVYFFTPDDIEAAAYRLIGAGELDEAIAELSFTIQDKNENPLKVSYRVQKSEMIDADKAEVLFGTRELENRESIKIGNYIATCKYNDDGEAMIYWHSTQTGKNCCALFSSFSDKDAVYLYANLLYAFVHSDMSPQ